jgi:hypothetical protein
MNPMVCQFAALSVAVLYCSWRRHHDLIVRKQRVLRERVAQMLWTIAQDREECDSLQPVS